MSLREKLIDVLKKKPQNSKIFVTGHSLGGVLATSAIPDIIKNTQANIVTEITNVVAEAANV